MNIDVLVFPSNRRSNNPIVHEAELMAESARMRGHEARLVFSNDFSFIFDTDGTKLCHHAEPYKRPDIVIAWVGMLNGVAERAAVLRELELMKVPIVNNFQPVVRTRDKFRTMQILSARKLPVIKTVLLSTLDSIDHVLHAVGDFPVIAKTIYGNDGKGVAVFESKRSLISGIELLLDNNIQCESILIQEFVKAQNKDYRLFVVGGKVVAQMERSAPEGDFRANLDGGGSGARADLPPEVLTLAEDAAKALALDIAGVDILLGENGPVICEINPRPGFKISQITGVNVAEEIIKWTEEKYAILTGAREAA
jgi:RimK family alpha-L-glutamate ligase